MRNLSNAVAGVAGLVILLGALAATSTTANGQNTRLSRASSEHAALVSATPPDLGACENLQVPEGNKLSFVVYAEGFQLYRWTGTTWSFVAPDAVLYADAGGEGLVGTHYAGPTWESNSGSKVVGRVVDRCTPDPNSIQWLKLEAAHTEGPGIFDRVTFIQRVNTVGGLAPTAPGNVVGEVERVPYTTEYYFYRAQD